MRRIVLSVLTVGLVVMLAGAGSIAFFSDSEEMSGRFEAGTLELTYEMTDNEVNWDGHEPVEDPFELEDVKPGDEGCFTYELELSGNPACVYADIELDASDEDIRDSLEFNISWNEEETGWFTWDEDGDMIRILLGEWEDGDKDNVEICWRIPTTVGNEIQGQSLDLEIRFKAEQLRHKERVEYPEGGTTTVAFEDLEINDIDWDYNDFVVAIDTEAAFRGTEEDNGLDSLEFEIKPLARGAMYDHAFGMKFPAGTFTSDGEWILTVYDGDNELVGTETGDFFADDDMDFTVIDHTSDALPGLANAFYCDDYVETDRWATLSIEFDELEPFDLGTIEQEEFTEFHGEELFFDPYLYVHNTDDTIPTGDVRTLTVPDDWKWPTEETAIWDAYDEVEEDADGSPTFVPEWWDNYDDDLVYDHHLDQ